MAVRTSLEYARGAEWGPCDQYVPTGYPFTLGTGGTIVGSFRRWGIIGEIWVDCTLGTGGGGGGATNYQFSLPTGWVARSGTNRFARGDLWMQDQNVPLEYRGSCFVSPGGSTVFLNSLVASTASLTIGGVTATAPFTWAVNDFFNLHLRLELAS